MIKALSNMRDPRRGDTDLTEGKLKDLQRRFVALRLLRRYHPIEFDLEQFRRGSEEIVVDVGDGSELELLL